MDAELIGSLFLLTWPMDPPPAYGMVLPIFVARLPPPYLMLSGDSLRDTPRSVHYKSSRHFSSQPS